MTNISLSYPYLLLLLLLLPCFLYCKIEAKILYFSKPEWLPKRGFLWDNSILWIMLIYTLLVIALSQPYHHSSQSALQKKGRDLVLVLDTSGSMAERGFNPNDRKERRYDASLAIAKDFISKRYDDNIGLVVFGTYAFTASPLTYDLKALVEMFGLMSDVGIAGTSTAIGDALMQGIRTLDAGEAQAKVLVLLTDGKHNAGKNSPRQVTELALKKGIKIYTIGIGKKDQNDQELLQKIAHESHAKSFFATTRQALELIYEDIEELEPSPIRSGEHLNKEELFFYPLILATLLLALLLFKEEIA